MSHRLEDSEDTKYVDYKEPKTSRRLSAEDAPASSQAASGAQDAESMWNIARESDNPSNKGSYADKGRSVDNVVKESSG